MKKLAKVIGCLRLKEMVKVSKKNYDKRIDKSYEFLCLTHLGIKTIFRCIFDFSNLILRGLNRYISKKRSTLHLLFFLTYCNFAMYPEYKI